MLKIVTVCLLIIVIALALPGCGSSDFPANDFTKMLDKVPLSFLENLDVCFGNSAMARKLNGSPVVNSMEDFQQLPEAEQDLFKQAWNEIPNTVPGWGTNAKVRELTGIDAFAFQQTILIGSAPPHQTYLASGTFDTAAIESNLLDLGYSKIEYGKYWYFNIGEDFSPNLDSPLSREVLAAMNRIAVIDGYLIVSPVTADVTGILDTMDGKKDSIMDNVEYKALAEKLMDPLIAVLTTHDRIVGDENILSSSPFNYPVPSDWDTLKGGSTAAIGYRAEKESRYYDIVLYYGDKANAETDAIEITKRMDGYSLTLLQREGPVPFHDFFTPGQPSVAKTGSGNILTISCKTITATKSWKNTLIGGNGMPIRDLLFLDTDPEKYARE